MKAFADLYAAVDETTKTNQKIAAMSRAMDRSRAWTRTAAAAVAPGSG